MQTHSRLLTLDVWLRPDSARPFQECVALMKSRIFAEVKVLHDVSHRFEPHGETWMAILGESHCALHTYPEHDYLSLDFYSCNPERDLTAFSERLVEGMDLERIKTGVLDRG